MRHFVALLIVVGAFAVDPVLGQRAPKVFAYPTKGQSQAQQDQDNAACTRFADAQAPVQQAPSGAGRHARGTVGGAARGAAVGAAVGAIAGDAGKGAGIGAVAGGVRGRRGSQRAEYEAQAGAQNDWARAFAACMEGKGYTVK